MSEPSSAIRYIEEQGLARQISGLIEPALEDLGFRLVRVHVSGSKDQTLQVMAERPDGTMTITDCETVSRQISPLLDAHVPLSGAYRFEVSSPGIDRPLVRPSDFDTWAGHVARIEMNTLIDGRRRFKGTLEGFEADEVRIRVELDKEGPQTLGLPLELVHEAHLVLTDALIKESLKRSKAAGADDDIADGSAPPDDAEIEDVGYRN
ncbi:MAG: ribosome maturation factor RimP [Pseudomonadota bacterium]